MGGSNQSTCPPPARTIIPKADPQSLMPGQFGAIRSHEDAKTNQVHFHDDTAGVKCCVPPKDFAAKFGAWLHGSGGTPLSLLGDDGKGGKATVQFHMFPDDQGDLQIGTIVGKVHFGKTVKDLMKLAGI